MGGYNMIIMEETTAMYTVQVRPDTEEGGLL